MAIFLQGCDLTCVHCHNPETWQPCTACAQCAPSCPGGALEVLDGALRHDPARCLSCDRCLEACASHASPRTRTLTVDEVLAAARPWVPYLDGLTFSGGECTLQWPFLAQCLPRLREELRLPTLLDTNGNMEPAVLELLLPLCEGLLFDVKALDPQVHLALTGAGNDRILANLHRAAQAGKLTEVRAVLIPGATDHREFVLALAQRVASLGPGIPLRLSPFRPQGVRGPWAGVPTLAPAAFKALCEPAQALLGERLMRS